MQKILVPTDFSSNSLKAITYAAEIAQKTGGTILLMHVIEPALNMATMQKDSSGEKAFNKCKYKLNTSLQSLSAIYPGLNVIPALTGGNTVASILEYAGKENVDLIVMGTTGASGLKEIFMGSVAAGVIGKTNIPVLTVPVSYQLEEPDAIVFATNQFEKNKQVLTPFVSLAKLFSAAVHVVIFKDIEGDKNADFIYNQEQLNHYLHYLKETFTEVDFKGEILEGVDFEITIDHYTNKNEADIITMITYPKSFFENLFRKSVTKKMAFHSTTPLLAIPAFS